MTPDPLAMLERAELERWWALSVDPPGTWTYQDGAWHNFDGERTLSCGSSGSFTSEV